MYCVYLEEKFSILTWSFSLCPRWAAWRRGATLKWQSRRMSGSEVCEMLHLYMGMEQGRVRYLLHLLLRKG